MAELTVRVANYLRGDKQEPFDLYDFMPYTERPEKTPQSTKTQIAMMKQIATTDGR